MTTWKFIAVRAKTPYLFRWHWRHSARGEGQPSQSSKKFDLYFDCVQDAREHGYTGPMPRPTESGAVAESPDSPPGRKKERGRGKGV